MLGCFFQFGNPLAYIIHCRIIANLFDVSLISVQCFGTTTGSVQSITQADISPRIIRVERDGFIKVRDSQICFAHRTVNKPAFPVSPTHIAVDANALVEVIQGFIQIALSGIDFAAQH